MKFLQLFLFILVFSLTAHAQNSLRLATNPGIETPLGSIFIGDEIEAHPKLIYRETFDSLSTYTDVDSSIYIAVVEGTTTIESVTLVVTLDKNSAVRRYNEAIQAFKRTNQRNIKQYSMNDRTSFLSDSVVMDIGYTKSDDSYYLYHFISYGIIK